MRMQRVPSAALDVLELVLDGCPGVFAVGDEIEDGGIKARPFVLSQPPLEIIRSPRDRHRFDHLYRKRPCNRLNPALLEGRTDQRHLLSKPGRAETLQDPR